MFIYIVALGLIIAGASAGTILGLQSLVREKGLSGYDARGYLVIAVLVQTFLIASLAYFWGVSRFGAPGTGATGGEGAIIGLLFSAFGCIASLGYGLYRIRGPQRFD